jgi:Mrp family chromosome partitioning ATPase
MFALSSGFILSSELLGALPTEPAAATPLAAAEVAAERSRDLAAAVRAIESARTHAGVQPEAIERLARELGAAGEGARRVTVIGAVRNVGTTTTAIALARSLAQQARVVLVDLALGAPHLSRIASDPDAPGLAELVLGSASFGQIITRDRYSRVHLIMAGREAVDAATVMTSQRLSITIEALGRSYDHVIIDAGTAEEGAHQGVNARLSDGLYERFANLGPRAVLVAPELGNPETDQVRQQLLDAGFVNVSVLVNAQGPDTEAGGTQAAA